MAEKYPEAQIVGTDLSAIQPGAVPPGVQFEIDDWDDDWTYSAPFDFVHNRFNCTAVSNWSQICSKSFAALKPGGWIELADLTNPPHSDDGSIPINSQLCQFFIELTEGCSKAGRDLHAPKKWPSYVSEAGFTNIHERTFKVPIGGWP
ncbi:Methyltransferase pytC [Fulvia fulva]|uniref:Methyltransferase pytC n=1 Tax=Passalora fulva TaxID=5499 RepID=A0A9Q8P3Y6_PASFU|nr:Methyltransferase pytC [Fulvia fulva]KAK4635936.1 Methyltransferase pytC [Fulvia fulva]KAK4636535.1 Methyltransferase pytC [Fulvia fulva]UJO12299.1 Methyltransferase pytC [Fulvia fulva]WPV09205.1 Methyltransferase pytC [Fulvia fulva]WPV23188.1 Methyltransferase pytC [Fulvia fulva]